MFAPDIWQSGAVLLVDKPKVGCWLALWRVSALQQRIERNSAVFLGASQDWTSFDVCGKLRGALKVKKVGWPVPRASLLAIRFYRIRFLTPHACGISGLYAL